MLDILAVVNSGGDLMRSRMLIRSEESPSPI